MLNTCLSEYIFHELVNCLLKILHFNRHFTYLQITGIWLSYCYVLYFIVTNVVHAYPL